MSESDLQLENARLQQENADLRAELESYEKGAHARRATAKTSVQVAWYITAGPELNKAIRRWLQTWVDEERVDVDQSADVAAAVIRRIFRVGTIGLLVALAPTFLLMMQLYLMHQQNQLIESQNNFFAAQNDKLQRQVDVQEGQRYAERREELVAIINARRPCPGSKRLCGFDNSTRERRKAFTELVSLERRQNGPRLDLTDVLMAELDADKVDLRGADLEGVDAHRVNLEKARLDKARAHRINLTNANLEDAKMLKIRLIGADLQGAILRDADLRGANLEGADLSRVDLRKADLRSANLKDADLDDAKLDKARYSSKTRWPRGFDPDDHGAVKR